MSHRRATAARASGTLISTPYDGGRVTFQDTCHCCHCGRVWLYRPGSKKVRGFCLRCMGHVCGPKCPAGQTCVAKEQMIENIEQGRPLDYTPIIVAVPADVPPARR